MKYAYIYDGSKHELKEVKEETDELEVSDYQSCVWLSEEEYDRFKNADVTKHHLEWDDEHKPVLVEYGAQEWIEMKDGKIISKAGYRFSETCVKAEQEVVYGYDGGMYYKDLAPEQPAPTLEEQKEKRAQAYLLEVDPITAHIQRERDEAEPDEEKIAALVEERNQKVQEIKERYPYPEDVESIIASGD